jgi:hypothetical protein
MEESRYSHTENRRAAIGDPSAKFRFQRNKSLQFFVLSEILKGLLAAIPPLRRRRSGAGLAVGGFTAEWFEGVSP